MNKKTDKLLIFLALLCMSPLILLNIIYNRISNKISILVSLKREHIFFRNKFNLCNIISIILSLFTLLINFILNINPNNTFINKLKSVISSICFLFICSIIFISLSFGINIIFITSLFISILLIIIGINLPTSKENSYLDTNSNCNIENYKKPKKSFSNLFIISGNLMFIITLISKVFVPYILITLIIITLIISCLYLCLLYKKQLKEKI